MMDIVQKLILKCLNCYLLHLMVVMNVLFNIVIIFEKFQSRYVSHENQSEKLKAKKMALLILCILLSCRFVALTSAYAQNL